MKSFQFRLQRVLQLRESEVKKEEAELERLYNERVKLEQERDALAESVNRMSGAAYGQQFLHPSQLMSLDRYKQHVKKELVAFASKLTKQQAEVDKQQHKVVEARGRVKLLEKLREKQQEQWEAERDRELDELVADFSTAQWLRQRR